MTNNIFNKSGKLNLGNLKKFSDVATNGCITIIRSSSGDRTKPSKALLEAIGNPEAVDFYFTEDQVIIVPSLEGSVKISKSDVIYNTKLAAEVMKISGGTFPENKSTKTGTFTIENVDETTSAAVISFDNSTVQTVDTATETEEEE